ncbi:hypothetical protein [Microcystis aeruginosa]|uniref:Uncharacterized protein n=1 Tax=Microcystis aeruginosa NIES-2521 TaxID=2303983 RepID=A0A5A5S1Y2_MICAE|nr:hypothetical protein [Microcystis aeruginosa]GCA80939.1 hypothetical protein MiTs_02948 [Microcystis aeruginosa NIES-2521]
MRGGLVEMARDYFQNMSAPQAVGITLYLKCRGEDRSDLGRSGVGCGVWGFTGFEVANYLIFREKVPEFSS